MAAGCVAACTCSSFVISSARGRVYTRVLLELNDGGMPAATRMGSTASQLLLVFELPGPIEVLLWHVGGNWLSSLLEDYTLAMAHAGESPDEAIGRPFLRPCVRNEHPVTARPTKETGRAVRPAP